MDGAGVKPDEGLDLLLGALADEVEAEAAEKEAGITGPFTRVRC